jgi:hypothetical protein
MVPILKTIQGIAMAQPGLHQSLAFSSELYCHPAAL